MAALFKVARHDKPNERKIIRAASIDGLILTARIKLKLTQEDYKIYTDDFTDIDEDEILMDLAKAKETHGEQLLLTIVPDGIPWNFNTLQENTSAPPTGMHRESGPTSSSTSHQAAKKNSSSCASLLPSHLTDHLSKIFPKLPSNIQSALNSGNSLKPRDRTSIVHIVRDYIIHDLKDLSLGTAGIISEQIVIKFEKTFTTKIGNTDGEKQSLQQAIYTAVRYLKGRSDEFGHQLSDTLDEAMDEIIEKPKVQDEYGCVAYLPVSPSPEVLDSLDEKRLKLIRNYCSPDEELSDEVLAAMKACYFLQRKEIHKEKKLSIIFEHWPYFHHYKLIIQHANELLGKETSSIWKASLNKLAKPINRWTKNEEIVREVKAKNKKSSPDDQRRYAREKLKIAKTYSDNLKNDEPYYAIVFDFIVKFMQEDLKFLFILINEELDNEELMQHVPVVNPVLIIRGQDLHHPDNVYNVVIQKEIVLHARSFTDGLLITFLCYYVFGIVYPSEIEGTFEVIQRLFLEICPPNGTKRGGKRKATNVHPKVTKLIKAIDSYIGD